MKTKMYAALLALAGVVSIGFPAAAVETGELRGVSSIAPGNLALSHDDGTSDDPDGTSEDD